MNLSVWKNIDQLIPEKFNKLKNLKRSGKAGLFAGSLELVKEGNLLIKQDEAAKFVAKKLGVPEELIRSPEEMQQAAQQFQEMQQMAQQQAGGNQGEPQ